VYRLTTMVQQVGVVIVALGLPAMFESIDEGDYLDNGVMVAGYVVMRVALPETVAHADAAVTAGAAMLLGAALATGDDDLLRHAFRDRLHEPYRAAGAPLLDRVKRLAPEALGVTLSGSGPTVIVWAERADTDRLAVHLTSELGATAKVSPVDVAREGAAAQVR
jgi:homoserine kinase